MSYNRRAFLKTGAGVAGSAMVGLSAARPLLAQLGARPEAVPVVTDSRLKAIIQRALDAAQSSGATYADARLVHTRNRTISTTPHGVTDVESITVGVRALVNGYWGFASGPIWSLDEMARLGREAVFQAKTNAQGKPRVVNLAPVPVVVDQHWDMPVRINPFEDVHPDEVRDHLAGLEWFIPQVRGNFSAGVLKNEAQFTVQSKAFGALTGTYCTQQIFRTEGQFILSVKFPDDRKFIGTLDSLSPAGLGWELYRDQPVRDQIRQELETIAADWALPVKPVDVGRYNIVLDAQSMAWLTSRAVGAATELDRAMGFEANAEGTSYLNDPLDMIGAFQVGASALTVSGNRSEPGGVASTKWDDEGCTPADFTMVRDGILMDYQTTRESAGWLADHYAKQGKPVRSYGCAFAPDGVCVPLPYTANLTMAPGKEALSYDGLITGMDKGMAFRRLSLNIDSQLLNGLGVGVAYEIKGGKRTALMSNAALLFRTPELLKGITAMGGKDSLRRFGIPSTKGEPPQISHHSVTACPVAMSNVTIVDAKRL